MGFPDAIFTNKNIDSRRQSNIKSFEYCKIIKPYFGKHSFLSLPFFKKTLQKPRRGLRCAPALGLHAQYGYPVALGPAPAVRSRAVSAAARARRGGLNTGT